MATVSGLGNVNGQWLLMSLSFIVGNDNRPFQKNVEVFLLLSMHVVHDVERREPDWVLAKSLDISLLPGFI